MSIKALIEIDGVKYMSTKTAADYWGSKPRTVANYCKNDRVHRKLNQLTRLHTNRWNGSAIAPLED